jgi:hypothetical protein
MLLREHLDSNILPLVGDSKIMAVFPRNNPILPHPNKLSKCSNLAKRRRNILGVRIGNDNRSFRLKPVGVVLQNGTTAMVGASGDTFRSFIGVLD